MKPARRAQLLASISLTAFYVAAQTTASDTNLLTKTRGLYDAPFTGNVVSFDCGIQFDWKKHITDLLGTIPPQGMALAEHLQPIPHRVFVDRSGAVVSAQPKLPDLTGVAHGADMEQVFSTMVSGGLNTWLPFARNIILPVEPTKYHFEKISAGYELTLKGQDVDALLNLQPDLRLTKGASRLPQALGFKTAFIPGRRDTFSNRLRQTRIQPAKLSFPIHIRTSLMFRFLHRSQSPRYPMRCGAIR
jgi:hypothetical protein